MHFDQVSTFCVDCSPVTTHFWGSVSKQSTPPGGNFQKPTTRRYAPWAKCKLYQFLFHSDKIQGKSRRKNRTSRGPWTYYLSREKFKIVSHWRPEWCSRGAFTVGLVVALKHLCNKSEVSRCWGHGTQDTKKLRSLKKCRTALQAELCVTIQLLFWKEETHMHSCRLLCEVWKRGKSSLMPLS